MGESERWLEDLVRAAPPMRKRRIGPVGESPIIRPAKLTAIIRDPSDGIWKFGTELEVNEAAAIRMLPRGHDEATDRSYCRLELTAGIEKLRAGGIDGTATLVVAEIPLSRACIFVAPFQNAGGKDGIVNLPDAYDEQVATAKLASHDPIGVTPGSNATRKGHSDLQAVANIAGKPRDPHLTHTSLRRAAIASHERREFAYDYHPNTLRSRWIMARENSRLEARRRMGVVAAAVGDFEQIADDIELTLDDSLRRWERWIERGTKLTGPGVRVSVSERLSDFLGHAAELSARQAFGGLAADIHDIGPGSPVSDLAKQYLDRHLDDWNSAIKNHETGSKNVLASPGFGEMPPAADQAEVMELLAIIEAADEPEKFALCIEHADRIATQFDWSPDVLRKYRASWRRKLDAHRTRHS